MPLGMQNQLQVNQFLFHGSVDWQYIDAVFGFAEIIIMNFASAQNFIYTAGNFFMCVHKY